MLERDVQRPIWVGAALLIGSALCPILQLEHDNVVAVWDVEKWGDSTPAYIVASLLAPVFALVVLLFLRNVDTVGRARGLLIAAVTTFALHVICPEPPVFITGTFDTVELDTRSVLSALVLLGMCGVVAGCLLARHAPGSKGAQYLTGVGGVWIVLAYLVPSAGGEPVITSFFSETSWTKMYVMTASLLLMLALGLWAAWALRPGGHVGSSTWLLRLSVIVAFLAPMSFVVTVLILSDSADLWYFATVVLRTTALYYGFAVLIVIGLVRGTTVPPSAHVG